MKDTKRRAAALLCAAALMLNLPAWALASENAAEVEPELIAAEVSEESAEPVEVAEASAEAVEESTEATEEADESAEASVETAESATETGGNTASTETGNQTDVITSVEQLNECIKKAGDGETITVTCDELTNQNHNIEIKNKTNLTLNLGTTKMNYKGTEPAYALRITGGSGITIQGGVFTGGGVYVREGAQKVALRGITIQNAQAAGILTAQSNLECIEGCTIDGAQTGMKLYNASSVTGGITGNRLSNIADKGILLTNRAENGKYVPGTGSWVAGNIADNVLTKVRGDGIGIYHGAHCGYITGNTLTEIGGAHNGYEGDYGIIVDSMIKEDTYAAGITNNTLTNVTYAGIVAYAGPNGDHKNMVFQDTAFVAGDISGNRLTNIGNYPHSPGWTKERKKGCLSGIYVDTHACVKGSIVNNSVDTVGEHGIYIHLKSWVNNISGNTVKNAKQDGIEVYTATVKGSITDNIISQSGEHGISALKQSAVQGKVEKNTVTGTGLCGIYLDQSKVKGALHKNKLTKVKKHGINLSTGSSAAKATSNTIAVLDAANSYGIRVTGKSKLPVITGNRISGKMNNGIRIDQLLAKTTISKNTLSVSGKKKYVGINLTGAPKLALVVTNNTITGNLTNYGVSLSKGIATVKGNTIKKCTCPINLVSSKFAVTVQGNRFLQNKENKVRAAGTKVDTAGLKSPKKVGKVTVSA